MSFLLASLAIGIFATAVLDVWAIALNRFFGFGLPNWGMVGRWFAGLPKGHFIHREGIAKAAPVANEVAIGWFMHYAIGVLFAAVTLVWWFSSLLGKGLFAGLQPALPLYPALVVGWVTILCGWLILSPGMGNGIAHAKAANPTTPRLLNIAGHTVFGLALWAGAKVILGWV